MSFPLRFVQRFSSTAATTTATQLPVQPTKVIVKKKGGFLQTIVGFVLGLSAVGASGYLTLVDEHQKQSNAVVASVESMENSVYKVSKNLARVDALELEVKKLNAELARRDDLEKLKTQIFKALDSLNVDHLETKTTVSELKQKLLQQH